jgi:hypothetical protein
MLVISEARPAILVHTAIGNELIATTPTCEVRSLRFVLLVNSIDKGRCLMRASTNTTEVCQK